MAEKNYPSRSFYSIFLHAATVGGRGVCVAQTCTDARSACKTAHRHNAPHAAEQMAAPMCISDLCRSSTVNLSARRRHWGQGSPCKLRFWYQTTQCLRFSCAARKAKSVVRFSFRLEEFFDFHFVQAMKSQNFCASDAVVATLVAM